LIEGVVGEGERVIRNLEIFVFISINILTILDIEVFVEFWIDSFLKPFSG